jgi:hypothetical protein
LTSKIQELPINRSVTVQMSTVSHKNSKSLLDYVNKKNAKIYKLQSLNENESCKNSNVKNLLIPSKAYHLNSLPGTQVRF